MQFEKKIEDSCVLNVLKWCANRGNALKSWRTTSRGRACERAISLAAKKLFLSGMAVISKLPSSKKMSIIHSAVLRLRTACCVRLQ